MYPGGLPNPPWMQTPLEADSPLDADHPLYADPLPSRDTWDTTRYGQKAGGTHPT